MEPGRGDRTGGTPAPIYAGDKDLEPVGTCGRYELLGRLASGGMADIFLARELAAAGASRRLVVKRILPHAADDERFVAMFLDEARLAMRLNHQNICHIYEFGETEDGTFFIAMEYVHGASLRQIDKRLDSNPMPVPIAAKIASEIAGALHYAHQLADDDGSPLGIVHRDVSPHNIMVRFDGGVKLLDFGIAKARTQLSTTHTGSVKGKFGYMSPEQCMGFPIDGRTDVFALGVVLWEMLAGRTLFGRETEIETMRAILGEEGPPRIRSVRPDVSKALDNVVMRALARRAEDRFESASELQMAIDEVLADERHVVNTTRVAEFIQPLFPLEVKRGLRLKRSLTSRAALERMQAKKRKDPSERPPADDSAAIESASDPSAQSYRYHYSGEIPYFDQSNQSGLTDADLAEIAYRADQEAAHLARASAVKVVLLAVALLGVIGGAIFAVAQALKEQPAAPVPAANGPIAGGDEGERDEQQAPRFRVVPPAAAAADAGAPPGE